MTTTASFIADTITQCAKLGLGYADMLVADIPADRFFERPSPTMNHPGFCFGHLAVYPNKMLELLGHDAVDPDEAFDDLFKAGAECVDQDGRYPSMDAILARFKTGHEAVLAALGSVDASVLEAENPAEGRFKEMCPTIGAAMNFLLGGHVMCHLGQVSAWRRAAGLPSAM